MSISFPIYMDYQATTPLDPRVLEEMTPYFTERFGNAASRNHSYGWDAEKAVDVARERIAKVIGADPREIIFTSGATESDNMALKGVAEMYKSKGKHIITSMIEHKAIIDSAKRLETWGYEVTYIEPPEDGITTAEMVEAAIQRRHHPRFHHDRQQRNRRYQSGQGDRPALPLEGNSVPHRRHPGLRKNPSRCKRRLYRSDVNLRA